MGNGNNRFLLTDYAQKFLEKQKEQTGCCIEKTMKMFWDSNELKRALEECDLHWCNDRQCYDCIDIEHGLYCPEIRHAYHRFIKNHEIQKCNNPLQEITAEDLAGYTRWLLLYADNDDFWNQPEL